MPEALTPPSRVGLVSDIHANQVAFEAVLEDMPVVDALVCAGDVVGYGPSPRACLDTLRCRAVPTVAGNHDRAVVADQPYELGDAYARQVLDESQLAWLADLPRNRRLFDGRLSVVHDHPDERDRYVFPPEFEPGLLGDEDVLVLGHTHVQHVEQYDEGLIVNPGSVGQPRDGEQTAAYAVLDLLEPSVECRRVEYAVSRVADRIRQAGITERNAKRLHEGR